MGAVTAARVLDVRSYTRKGAALTEANFEQALRDALAAAYPLCGQAHSLNGTRGSIAVYIPPGNWPMKNGIFIRPQWTRYSPSIIGLGPRGSVVLRFAQSADFAGIGIGVDASGAIIPGDSNGSNYSLGVTLQNLHIIGDGGGSMRGGIRARNTFKCTLRDVTVQGAGQFAGAPWHERCGIDFRNSIVGEEPSPNQNHQHVYFEHVQVAFSFIGFWFGQGLWSGTIIDGDANGCEYPAVYEGATIGWWGGNCQGGTDGARHSSGAMHTLAPNGNPLPSGEGATVTAASDGYSTVNGLRDLEGWTGSTEYFTYKSCWLELGTEVYRIAEVLSATSCIVRRSTNNGYQSDEGRENLSWAVRGCSGANEVVLSGQIYHETTDGLYYLECGPDLQTASYWTIDAVQTKTQNAIVCATGCQGQIALRNCRGAGALAARINQTRSFTTDKAITEIDTDDFSRANIVARYPAALGGGVWDAKPRAARYNSALLERGAVIFDARKRSSVEQSGGSVVSWSDLTGTFKLARANQGCAPQWVTLDATLGAPAVRLVGGDDVTLIAGLIGDVGPAIPDGPHTPTLLIVARIPESAQSECRRISLRAGNGSLDAYLGFDDRQHSRDRDFYACYYVAYPDGRSDCAVAPNLVPSDTAAHWLYATFVLSGTETGGGGSDAVSYRAASGVYGTYRAGPVFPATLNLTLLPALGPTGDLIVSHVAVLPSGLTIGERDTFRDLAHNEFNLLEG